MTLKIEGKLGENQTRREQEETMEARAQRIIAEEIKKAGLPMQTLQKERKGHPVKVKLAQRLRSETTMSLKWIAETLKMGTWINVSNLLRHQKRTVKSIACTKDKER